MNEASYEPFLENIMRVLGKNGFPLKRVTLPLERMYEAAYEKQLNFNKALTLLASRGVDHEKTAEKIIFFQCEDDHLARAAEALKNMSTEQIKQMEELFRNMSDEQKYDMMKQAR
jgi:hypothetical protein